MPGILMPLCKGFLLPRIPRSPICLMTSWVRGHLSRPAQHLLLCKVCSTNPAEQAQLFFRGQGSLFCKGPDRIFGFAGLNVFVATTQLNVASKVALDNSARQYINDRCGCILIILYKKQTAGRLGSGTVMCQPLLSYHTLGTWERWLCLKPSQILPLIKLLWSGTLSSFFICSWGNIYTSRDHCKKSMRSRLERK